MSIRNESEVFLSNLEKFEKAYLDLDTHHMWALKSNHKVEEVIYEYARKLTYKSYLHSYIINDVDPSKKSLFSKEKWEEITISEVLKNNGGQWRQWRQWDKWEAIGGCGMDRLEIMELAISDYS
ncbi:4210_t:CDS:2, partial [Funneliformis caledonium]